MGAVGCQKETSNFGIETIRSTHEIPVNIHASLADSQGPTKAIVRGTDIPDHFSYGLFVCAEGKTNEAHKKNSWNLKSSYTEGLESEAGSWSFQYVDNFDSGALSANTYDHITITSRDDNATADLYAYAPHIEGKINPKAIPFEIAPEIRNQVDLMYAEENDDPTANKGLDPLRTDVDALEANFTFKHALALLAFEFEIKNHSNQYSTNYRLQSITIQKKDPQANTTAQIYQSGTFNAITGNINYDDCNKVDKLVVSQIVGSDPALIIPNGTSDPDYTAYVALVPTQIEDNELEVTIVLNKQNKMTVKPFVLKKQFVKHLVGEEEYGFQGGYIYTFRFTMDNYLYLTDFNIKQWDDTITHISSII